MTAETVTSREDVAPVEAEPDDLSRYASPIASRLDEPHRIAAAENTRIIRENMKAMIAAAAARRCGSVDNGSQQL